MKSIRIGGAVALAIAAAAPLMAQPAPGYNSQGYGNQGYGNGGAGYGRGPGDGGGFWRGAPDSPRERIEFLQQRINRGISDGSLDRKEARRSQMELNNIRRMAMDLHRRDGGPFTPDDRAMIQRRLDDLSQRIRWRRHDW